MKLSPTTPARTELPKVGDEIVALDGWHRGYAWGRLVVTEVEPERKRVRARYVMWSTNHKYTNFPDEVHVAFAGDGSGLACLWNFLADITPEERGPFDRENQRILDFLASMDRPDFLEGDPEGWRGAVIAKANKVAARRAEFESYRERFTPEVIV